MLMVPELISSSPAIERSAVDLPHVYLVDVVEGYLGHGAPLLLAGR
jgi:hypothetical protein